MARSLPPISVSLCVASFLIFLSKGADEYKAALGTRVCNNGELTAQGLCACKPCWTGDNCDIRRNRFVPKFEKDAYDVNVWIPYGDGVDFFIPSVSDGDAKKCRNGEDCPCADVSFSISAGNDDELFTINSHTGALSISQGTTLTKQKYILEITARNLFSPEHDKESRSKVNIFCPSNDDNSHEDPPHLHHIQKRSSSVVNNVTFDLTKKYPYNETTEMKVGSRVRFELKITFPAEDTDMLVELFTPDNDTTVMILCDVNVTHIGSSLSFNGSQVPTMDARVTGSVMYDRAIINFGVVENTGCSSAYDCSIYIEYEAILVENTITAPGEIYWVSAGAEYNNENEVWVGQASFVAYPNDTSVSETPTFNFTGPSSLAIGSAGVFQVDMFLPYPSTALSFDAFAPINTSSVMSICSAKLKSLADNFKCGYDANAVSTQYYSDSTGIGNSAGHLQIGKLTNKGSRDISNIASDNLVSVEFVAHLFTDPSFVGQSYWVGAAFEIGSDQIWAGQMQVTATSETDASSMASPVLSFNPASGQTVAKGDAVRMILEIELPAPSTTSYTVTIQTAWSTTPVFKLCSVTILSIGENMPCVIKGDKKVEYSSRTTNSPDPDTATLNLGGITNLNLNTSGNASTITLEIYVTPLNHSLATDLSSHDVTATLTYSGIQTVTATSSVQISGASAVVTSVSNSTSPSFDMSYVFGNENVNVGAATRIKLEITTNRSISYPMMNMEFIMPLGNTSTKFSVCRIIMASAGRNIPCLSPDWVNSQVTYQSQFNETVNDQALMYLGTVCNYGIEDNTTEDVITIFIDAKVEDHTELQHGSKEWISAGNQYSDTKIWVGQLALFSQRGNNIVPTTTPYINLIKNTTLTEIPVGYPSIYSVLMKIPPQQSAQIKITAAAGQSQLSICGLRIKDVGDNLPCINKKTVATLDSSSGILDLGIVTNTGSDSMTSNDFYDSNTILVELIVRLSSDKVAVVDGNSYTFDLGVEYTSTGLKRQFNGQPIVATHNTSVANFTGVENRTTNNFYIGQIGGNASDARISPGESRRFVLDVLVPESVTQQLSVKFLTSVTEAGHMEICDSRVTWFGENFPCYNVTDHSGVLSKRSGSSYNDIATFGPIFLSSTPINSGNTTANTIRLEAIARLLPTSTKPVGSYISFHVTVNTNDIEIYVAQIDLEVTNSFTDVFNTQQTVNETLLFVNTTDTVIPINVGVLTTLPIVVNIPPDSMSKVLFDVDLPINGTAIVTVEDIRVSSTGSNIGCLYENKTLQLTFSSSYNSSLQNCQNNKASLDLGIVTNTGYSHTVGTYSEGDNSLLLEVDIRLQDNVLVEHGSQFTLSFGAKFANYVVIYNQKISAVRSGNEKPELDIEATYNTSLSSHDTAIVEMLLKHTNLSTATAVNTSVFIYIPPYMIFSGIHSNMTYTGPFITEGIVEFQFSELCICDVVSSALTLSVNNSISVPTDIQTEGTVIAYETVTNMIDRNGSIYTSGYDFTSGLKSLNFSLTVTRAGVCDQPLGMANGHIDDCQLDGSIENDPARPPSHGRYNGDSAWRPFSRGATFSKYRYFQVYFGNKTLVTKLIIQKGAGYTNHPTELILKYSDDGFAWQTGETVFLFPPYTETIIYPTNQVEARYIRVYISKDDSVGGTPPEIGVKFEFFGCYTTSEHSASNICNTAPSNTYPVDFYFRSFHVYNGNVYMCDINPRDRDLRQHCHYSNSGSSWTAMDKRIASLLGHDSFSNEMFAYENDKKSTLRSKDSGVTWESIPRDYYLDIRSKSTFVAAKKVPMITTNLAVPEPYTDYQSGDWGVTYTGLWKRSIGIWNRVVEWDFCCST